MSTGTTPSFPTVPPADSTVTPPPVESNVTPPPPTVSPTYGNVAAVPGTLS